MVVTWDARVKLQVLGETAQPSPGTAVSAADLNAHDANKGKSILPSSPLRIRTTYERSAATVKSDSPDPQAEGIEQSYKRLEGQVIEFTIGPAGHVSDVEGLKNVVDSDQVRQAAEQWMAQVSGPAVAPNRVAIGQTWSSTEPADSMPLAGMIWRSSSTYLRNESCRPAKPDGSGASPDTCAVILTRQSVVPRKQLRDPTPDDYRRNGLHTAGHWTGSGESLSYISLNTHVAVSVIQDSSQQIDFTVTNASGNSVRYAGTVETHSRVELLPPGYDSSN